MDDEGRSIEDPLTWIELEYDKPIPVSAVKKVHDESIIESLSNNVDVISIIKDHFVVDSYPVSGPSFLLPDGSFIDLTSSYNSETSFEDFPAHAEVEDFL
mgnify:CR=1 FL=1